jgi:AcrR family transcriptional regulator
LPRLTAPRDGDDPARDRIALAMVALAGEDGLHGATVEALCARAQVSPERFHRCFSCLDDCFLSAHDEVATDFWDRLHAACEEDAPFRDRLWAAGAEMMRFLEEDPRRGRYLLLAVNGAGADAAERRDRLVRRLADLLDEEPRNGGSPGVSRSRATAEIAAGAVYRLLTSKVEAAAIERGEDFLPELIHTAILLCLGAEAAEDELAVGPLH